MLSCKKLSHVALAKYGLKTHIAMANVEPSMGYTLFLTRTALAEYGFKIHVALANACSPHCIGKEWGINYS